jgi:SAM-dependent methyltransferase
MQTTGTNVAEMYATNRRHWDELAGVHLAPGGYDLGPLRAGHGRLTPIEEAELPEATGGLAGSRVIHLQCHFGLDTLTMAQRGARVVGVDFSPLAIAAARELAAEVGLSDRARFVECNLYDAPLAVGEASAFDLAFATWGTIGWLPDVRGWARVVAHFLKPGGRLYFADAHPAALVLDDLAREADGRPGWVVPYFEGAAFAFDDAADYANDAAVLANARIYTWLHPIGDVIGALMEAGLALRFLHEHDAVPWRMFQRLVRGDDGLWRWPDRRWWPLALSLVAEKR